MDVKQGYEATTEDELLPLASHLRLTRAEYKSSKVAGSV
jgi:hypothetical protein